MKSVCVGIVQLNSGASVESNLQQAQRGITEAVEQGAQLVVLPECFASYGDGGLQGLLEQLQRLKIEGWLSELSQSLGVWLIAGTIPVTGGDPDDDRVCSRCLVFDSQGREVSYYDKIHLFDVSVADDTGQYRESRDYQPGKHTALIDTPWGRIAPLICYDLRFPELFKVLALSGAELFFLPSAFTAVTGSAHWKVLLRARAIENGAFVIAANQCGSHGQRKTWGHSMVVNPWGQVVTSAAEVPRVLVVKLDSTELDRARESIPSLQHHKLSGTWYSLPIWLNGQPLTDE